MSSGMEAERWFHRRRSAHKPRGWLTITLRVHFTSLRGPDTADDGWDNDLIGSPPSRGLYRFNRRDLYAKYDFRWLSRRTYLRFWIDKNLQIGFMSPFPKSEECERLARRDDRSNRVAVVLPLTNSDGLPAIMSPTCSPGWHESIPFNDDESGRKIGDNLTAITLRRPNNYVRAIRF